MNNKKGTRVIINIIVIFIAVIAFLLLCFSLYKIFAWYSDNKENQEILSDILKETAISDDIDSENTEVVNPPENKSDSYYNYVNMDLMNVNFDDLVNINKDTVGWIKVGGTNINYPVVQSNDNSYYLNHNFYKNYNGAGWIFMDYRNNSKDLDYNTIIYGHSMKDKSMFYTLRYTLNNNWLNNESYHTIKFSTLEENTLWQVFSVYTIKAESYYITPDFSNEEDYEIWLNDMKSRSKKDFGTSVNSLDKVLTLSSCYNTSGVRMVLHAKLIKKEAR